MWRLCWRVDTLSFKHPFMIGHGPSHPITLFNESVGPIFFLIFSHDYNNCRIPSPGLDLVKFFCPESYNLACWSFYSRLPHTLPNSNLKTTRLPRRPARAPNIILSYLSFFFFFPASLYNFPARFCDPPSHCDRFIRDPSFSLYP